MLSFGEFQIILKMNKIWLKKKPVWGKNFIYQDTLDMFMKMEKIIMFVLHCLEFCLVNFIKILDTFLQAVGAGNTYRATLDQRKGTFTGNETEHNSESTTDDNRRDSR